MGGSFTLKIKLSDFETELIVFDSLKQLKLKLKNLLMRLEPFSR